VSRKVEH